MKFKRKINLQKHLCIATSLTGSEILKKIQIKITASLKFTSSKQSKKRDVIFQTGIAVCRIYLKYIYCCCCFCEKNIFEIKMYRKQFTTIAEMFKGELRMSVKF